MSLLRPIERASKFSVKLSFFKGNNSTPISLVKMMGKDLDEHTETYIEQKLLIHDGHLQANQFNLDRERFAFKPNCSSSMLH